MEGTVSGRSFHDVQFLVEMERDIELEVVPVHDLNMVGGTVRI